MNNETEKKFDIIKKAIMVIKDSLNDSSLPDVEKNALRVTLDRLIIYYDKRLSVLQKKGIDIDSNNSKVCILKTFMTDIIVEIDTVIKKDSDIFYFISEISKRLNDKELEKIIKKK